MSRYCSLGLCCFEHPQGNNDAKCVRVAQVRVKCNEDDTIGDLKKLIAAQVGTRPEKIRIQKWYTVYKVGG